MQVRCLALWYSRGRDGYGHKRSRLMRRLLLGGNAIAEVAEAHSGDTVLSSTVFLFHATAEPLLVVVLSFYGSQ